MSIYEYDEEEHMRMEREESWQEGNREGLQTGRKEGIKALIETCQEFGQSSNIISAKLMEKFRLSKKEADRYIEEYFQN